MDIRGMVAVVQSYINHRKGVEVQINLQQFNNPINLIKLQTAYSTALNWFESNKGNINYV